MNTKPNKGWIKASGVAVSALALAVGALAWNSPKVTVRTAIDIDVPVERVFAALADFGAYPEWNPYHVSVSGEPQIGAALTVDVRRPDGKQVTVKPHLLRFEPQRELTWGGGIRGVFYGEHVFLLQSLPDGRTRLIHNEDFSGFAVRFADLPAGVLTEGYRQMNEALKLRLESREQFASAR